MRAQLACVVLALALAACSREAAEAPAPEAAAPAPSVCADIEVTSASAAGEMTFNAVTPNAPAGVSYFWSVTAGAITDDPTAATISVDAPTGEEITASVEVRGLQTDCTNYGSATVTMP